MLHSSIRRAKLSSVITGTSSSADSRHSHASSVSSRAQEPRGHGSLRPLQRGRVDDLANPLLLRHAHGYPRDRSVRERRLRSGTHRGGCDRPDPLPARGCAGGSTSTPLTLSCLSSSLHNRHNQPTVAVAAPERKQDAKEHSLPNENEDIHKRRTAIFVSSQR